MINKKKIAAILAVYEVLKDTDDTQKVTWSERRVGWHYSKDKHILKESI